MTTAPIPVLAATAGGAQSPRREAAPAKISVRGLNFFYGRAQSLHNISLDMPGRVVMAFIGPSCCGKSTFLRAVNRLNDTLHVSPAEVDVSIDGAHVDASGAEL